MLPGLELMTAGLLTLAAAGDGGIECKVPRAPQITITPTTKEIEYDETKTEDELGQFKTSTVNPYGASADTSTGGLRHDKPELSIQVKIGYQEYPSVRKICLWYDSVNIGILLQPKIYIAKDLKGGPKCHEAVMIHEKRHVNVDREVMNNFARDMGAAISDAVNSTGALGPLNRLDLQGTQDEMSELIKGVMKARQSSMEREMQSRQAEVDSLEEYERISAICNSER